MSFTAAAPSRSLEKEVVDKSSRAAPKEDKPCSRCGHLCSGHSPANYTRMYCEVEGCSCEGYFPPKSYEAVVNENLTLLKRISELEATVKQLSTEPQAGRPNKLKTDSASC